MEDIKKIILEYKLAFVFILAGLILGCFFLFLSPQKESEALPVEISQSSQSSSSKEEEEDKAEKKSQASETSFVTVDIKGAVRQPGVYQLPENSRVKDAVAQAGGLVDDADSKSINLAQKVKDEEVIYVSRQGEGGVDVTQGGQTSAAATGQAQKENGKVNLNKASLAELQTVSGIGAKRAQDIIDYRESNGPFQSVDDLKNVSGIGGKTLEKLRDYVTVD